ncbi:hypothetical protein KY332_05340 [Candidatus Woesearchaeota archaeon]|nr:hypothetical protein [Candidatus Woesearchaeota archaeon]
MTTIPELIKEISGIIGVKLPKYQIGLEQGQLENILYQLRDYKIPDMVKPKGDRPERLGAPSEKRTDYRQKLADYIELNTKITLPVNSTVPARFYDSIADYLGL